MKDVIEAGKNIVDISFYPEDPFRLDELSKQKIINVGSGISTSFNQIIEIISKQVDEKIIPRYIKKESSYIENLKANTKLMKSILKIDPISIESGIEKFAKYLNLIN